jgi:hypothetical protein
MIPTDWLRNEHISEPEPTDGPTLAAVKAILRDEPVAEEPKDDEEGNPA